MGNKQFQKRPNPQKCRQEGYDCKRLNRRKSYFFRFILSSEIFFLHISFAWISSPSFSLTLSGTQQSNSWLNRNVNHKDLKWKGGKRRRRVFFYPIKYDPIDGLDLLLDRGGWFSFLCAVKMQNDGLHSWIQGMQK